MYILACDVGRQKSVNGSKKYLSWSQVAKIDYAARIFR